MLSFRVGLSIAAMLFVIVVGLTGAESFSAIIGLLVPIVTTILTFLGLGGLWQYANQPTENRARGSAKFAAAGFSLAFALDCAATWSAFRASFGDSYSATNSAQDQSAIILLISVAVSLAATFALLRSLRLVMIAIGDEDTAKRASSTRNLLIATIVGFLVSIGMVMQSAQATPATKSASVIVGFAVLIAALVCLAKYLRTLKAVGTRLEFHAIGE